MTKQDQILEYMMSGKEITPRIAVAEFDAWRLADSVAKLKAKGYEIENIQAERGAKHGIYRMTEESIKVAKDKQC